MQKLFWGTETTDSVVFLGRIVSANFCDSINRGVSDLKKIITSEAETEVKLLTEKQSDVKTCKRR